MEFESVDFWGEEENGVALPASQKKQDLAEQGKEQQQPPPIYGVDSGIWTRATLMGGERPGGYCHIYRYVPLWRVWFSGSLL